MTRWPYSLRVYPVRGPLVRRYRYLAHAWLAWFWLGVVLGYSARLYDERTFRLIAHT